MICNFCLSVAARKIVWADPSLRYTSWDVKQATNQQTIVPVAQTAATDRDTLLAAAVTLGLLAVATTALTHAG